MLCCQQRNHSRALSSFTSACCPFCLQVIAMGSLIYGLDNAGSILAQYPFPPSQVNDSRPTASHIVTDSIWTCSLRNLSHIAVGLGHNVYFYHFNHPASFSVELWGDAWYCYNAVSTSVGATSGGCTNVPIWIPGVQSPNWVRNPETRRQFKSYHTVQPRTVPCECNH